jgi:hypothetical protein
VAFNISMSNASIKCLELVRLAMLCGLGGSYIEPRTAVTVLMGMTTCLPDAKNRHGFRRSPPIFSGAAIPGRIRPRHPISHCLERRTLRACCARWRVSTRNNIL